MGVKNWKSPIEPPYGSFLFIARLFNPLSHIESATIPFGDVPYSFASERMSASRVVEDTRTLSKAALLASGVVWASAICGVVDNSKPRIKLIISRILLDYRHFSHCLP